MPIDAHDIEGFGQLTGEAVVEISKLVEAAQKNVARLCGAFVPIAPAAATAITGLIHHTVRGMTPGTGTKHHIINSFQRCFSQHPLH